MSAGVDRREGAASLVLDAHVVGRAHAEAPLLLATLRGMGDAGLGARRTRMSLVSVEALDGRGLPCGTALDPVGGRLSAVAPGVRARELVRPGDETARVVRVRYVSPTWLKEGGEVVREPRFGALMRRLRARLGALATVFGEREVDEDPRAMAAAADAVAMIHQAVTWYGQARRSTRTGQTHPLEGFVGEAVYQGELGRFLPMLRLGELLHVGKHATFGLGRIEVEVLG
ncbi:CRISPR system precrRNA processing endoribonuclease RAMP protein Cas6 [Chondromyces crocatus]|uniref:CRISPR system precrRNA processing endoribonuclease RAMP protein Cas6 n=1 Tax=Chondromyces crocatus TaxID=52 RepID=UPI00147000F9|nr:CRISPR system precrRNA processing endoribonuclease RAMP protein Cas6 [Chondromyces crocatus]